MKKFKLIFHIVYVLLSLTILYFSIDILANTQAYLSKIKLSSYITFPKYVMGLFLFISILMLVEFTLQQIALYKSKGHVNHLKEEITQLKARLYDKDHAHDEEPASIGTINEPAEEENSTPEEKNPDDDDK